MKKMTMKNRMRKIVMSTWMIMRKRTITKRMIPITRMRMTKILRRKSGAEFL